MPDDSGYELIITPEAEDDLSNIDKTNGERIIKKMRWVAEMFTMFCIMRWKVNNNEGYFRWRVGDYRVLYELDHEGHLLIVGIIGHRREIYDKWTEW